MRYTLTEMKAKRHNDTGLLGVLAMVLEDKEKDKDEKDKEQDREKTDIKAV